MTDQVQDQVNSLWGDVEPGTPQAPRLQLPVGEKITLRIPGKPQPGGSKRTFTPKGWDRAIVVDANPKAKDWKRTVQVFAAEAMTWKLLEGPLRVSMTFLVARPKGHIGKHGVKPKAPTYPTTKPDLLKLARSTEDALTGIVWRDDARIVTEILQKRYASDGKTGAIVEIEELW